MQVTIADSLGLTIMIVADKVRMEVLGWLPGYIAAGEDHMLSNGFQDDNNIWQLDKDGNTHDVVGKY